VIVLRDLTPAAEEGWWLLFDLMAERVDTCLLVGGQLMALLAAEHGSVLPRTTDDLDVVVNVQQHRKGTEWLAQWLVDRGFDFAQPSADNIGHRFTKPTDAGRGTIVFDVLAPAWLGRAQVALTRPPARTVQAPGSTTAFSRSGLVDVCVSGILGRGEQTGQVRRPDLLGALVMKAAGIAEIAVRSNPERDWQDVALLLALIPDPVAEAERCSPRDRRRLRHVEPLLDREHLAWAPMGDDEHRCGSSALEFLLDGP
jgi:hypothetical protein